MQRFIWMRISGLRSSCSFRREDKPADSWTDTHLDTGALGFYDVGNHLPKLLALSFTFMKDSASRTALVSLP